MRSHFLTPLFFVVAVESGLVSKPQERVLKERSCTKRNETTFINTSTSAVFKLSELCSSSLYIWHQQHKKVSDLRCGRREICCDVSFVCLLRTKIHWLLKSASTVFYTVYTTSLHFSRLLYSHSSTIYLTLYPRLRRQDERRRGHQVLSTFRGGRIG